MVLRTTIFAAALAGLAVGLAAIWVAAGRQVPDPDDRARGRRFFTILALVVALGMTAAFYLRVGIAFGVIGAGLAFAAQEVIVGVAGWMTVLFGHFFRVGDRVQLGGIRGDVIEIGILRTRIMEIGQWVDGDLYNGRIVLVANSFVRKEPVYNYSGQFPFIWDEVAIPIRYDTDPAAAREMLERVVNEVTRDFSAEAEEAWNRAMRNNRIPPPDMEPMVTVRANDNWMQFTARYMVDYRRRRKTQNAIYSRIMEEVRASGGAIHIASTTTQIVPPSSLDIVVRRNRERA